MATGPFSIFYGRGDGTFTPAAASSVAQSISAADFDRDGHLDLAAATAEFGSYRMGWGDGGQWLDVHHVPFPRGSPIAVAHGNLDERDVRPEVIIVAHGAEASATVTVLGVNGRNLVELHHVDLDGFSWNLNVMARDFDGDSAIDVLVVGTAVESNAQPAPATLTLLRGTRDRHLEPDATFPVPGVVTTGKPPAVARDFDRDGDADLAIANPSSRSGVPGILVLLNNGNGRFDLGPRLDAGTVTSLTAGDLFGDGLDDLVAVTDRSRLLTFSSHGDGWWFTRADHSHVGGASQAHALGDWDGNGRLDVAAVGVAANSAVLTAFLNEAATMAQDCDQDGVPDGCEIAFGEERDCDGDGRIDRCAERAADPCAGALFAYAIEGPSELSASAAGGAVDAEYRLVMTPLGAVRENRDGVSGWVLSIAAEACEIVAATTRGTAAARIGDNATALRSDGYERTELASDGAVSGAVSAVILSSVLPTTLPSDGPSVICRLEVRAKVPPDARVGRAGLAYRDGLQRDWQPVSNSVTWQWRVRRPALSALGIRVIHGARAHRRGDTSSDGAVDIADSVFLLSHLFLGREPPRCADAADSDDSGTLSLTDAVLISSYLFLGGEPRPAPGPGSCGEDPTADLLGCDEYPSC